MPSVKRRASKILNEYGAAQSELIGKAVVLTDGKAGKVENVWLDELHGLRISIEGHDGRWPVSTPEEQQHDPTHLRGISTRLIDWSPFVIMGNTMPPRDPDEDEEDEEEEDRADEPPVVREPDED